MYLNQNTALTFGSGDHGAYLQVSLPLPVFSDVGRDPAMHIRRRDNACQNLYSIPHLMTAGSAKLLVQTCEGESGRPGKVLNEHHNHLNHKPALTVSPGDYGAHLTKSQSGVRIHPSTFLAFVKKVHTEIHGRTETF